MISFVNAQGSVQIRLASSNIATHSNGYIKGDKYFFYKSRCAKCSPETKLFTKYSRDTMQKDHIYHTKQYQTFYRMIKCDLYNFKGVKMANIRIVSIWWFLFIFFIKWQHWCKVLCLINCNHQKKNFDFLMERPYYTF